MSVQKFEKAQADLNQKVADLKAEFGALVAEIQKSGIHFPGFSKLKRTAFALEKAAKKNGIHEPRKRASAGEPNNALFDKAVNPVAEKRDTRPKSSPPDLFNRAENLKRRQEEAKASQSKSEPKQVKNLFDRKEAVTVHHDPVPSKKAAKKKSPGAKVMATSEDNED